MKLFHICTIANKLAQYEEMKSSFIEAGFDEFRCRYSVFDNSQGNIYEPYSTFNTIRSNTVEPYIIFCHQDVLLNQGHGFDRVVKLLEELDKLDSNWALAGNAGINNNYENVTIITDPHNSKHWSGGFPERVHSLDENFLVVKSSANIASSSELKGFHFYATDLCLNAILKGYSCYVINFHLTHLSPGKISQDFWKSRAIVQKRWSREFNFCYVQTPCSFMFLSKHKALQYIFNHTKVMQWFLSHRSLRVFANVRS